MNPTGLQLEHGWKARSVAVWRDAHPDMLALSPNGKWLYISCETMAGINTPSLATINLKTGRKHMLISGLMRADALKFAPDDSLWIGEEFPEGLIWRVADVDKLPEEQFVKRATLSTSHDAIAPYRPAGQFAHEGISFSADHRFAYLADEDPHGAIYRLELQSHHLEVLDGTLHWQAIQDPAQARLAAIHMHATPFNRIEDMETLPDGRIVMAETGTGRILALQDHGDKAEINTFMQNSEIIHPDNLAWDSKRKLLWITDDSTPSALWTWDGIRATRIALHQHAEITGVLPVANDIYINLQTKKNSPELTVKLYRPALPDDSSR